MEEVQQRIQQIKLQRLQELNLKLKESLLRKRIPTSQASKSYVIKFHIFSCTNYRIISYAMDTPDYLIPTIWKLSPDQNRYQKFQVYKTTRRLQPKPSGCCTIM